MNQNDICFRGINFWKWQMPVELTETAMIKDDNCFICRVVKYYEYIESRQTRATTANVDWFVPVRITLLSTIIQNK